MITIDEIREQAKRAGACRRAAELQSVEDACRMLFTAQGREFAEKRGFPTAGMFAQAGDLTSYGIYNDYCGEIPREHYDIAVSGDSDVTIVADRNDRVYRIVLLHRAKARIYAGGYAVVLVAKTGGCECEITKDGTAKIL